MKKIELHVHLDGSVRPKTISELLNIDLKEAFNLSCLDHQANSLKEYLTKFAIPLKAMQTKENLKRIAKELAQDLLKDDVIYAEIRFAPHKHLENNLSLDEVITSVLEGLREVPLKTNLILCMMREYSFTKNLEVLKLAKKYLNKGVVAIDLAGNEALYPVLNYQKLFTIAKKENIPYTIHAGEADGPESVINAINLKAKRIGHGIRAIESKEALKLIKEQNITLEVCPKSNLDTNIYNTLSKHPLLNLYQKNIHTTINTDNRTVSNITLNETYQTLKDTFNFTTDDFLQMNKWAIEAAFISPKEKQELLQLLLK